MILIYGYLFYYLAALIGISIGYHRYFTHRSFNASPAAEWLMLSMGLLCGGRSPLTWAAVHRMHHAASDTPNDPHSPEHTGAWNVLASRWTVDHIPRKYIKDLIKNPRLQFFHRYGQIIHIGLAALILFFLGLNAFLVIIVIPFLLAWFGFGFLNYITHRNGEPEDIPIMTLLAPGEGWHKYHHDNPREYSLSKYDIAGWTIKTFFDRTKYRS